MAMNVKLKQTLKFSGFLILTLLLFFWVYKDQDWTETFTALEKDVNYFWIAVGAVLGLLSHLARALRWQLLSQSMGCRISLSNSFMAIMTGYFANMLIPRMGEVSRCGIIARYEKLPFAQLLGTVVTERIIDLCMLLAFTLAMVITQFDMLMRFFTENTGIADNITAKADLLYSRAFWLITLTVLLVAALLFVLLRRFGFYHKVKQFLSGLKEGILTVRNVKQRGLFIFYSLFIWLMFFLMLYVSFFCFEFSSGLGLGAALTIFVLSSYGMVAPVQGGIGAWHFMAIASMMLYLPDLPGIESSARTFAFLTHGSMTMLYIAAGGLSMAILPFYNRYRKKHQEKIN